jgi:CHAD domain-containing protein
MTRARELTVSPKASTAMNARRIAGVRIDELFCRADAVTGQADSSDAWHDVRIAAKRLRYALELFPQVFGKRGEAEIDVLRSLQEELGQLHDLDMVVAKIVDELGAVTREEIALARAGAAVPALQPDRAGLLALLARVSELRDAQHAAVTARWNAVTAGGFEARLRNLV